MKHFFTKHEGSKRILISLFEKDENKELSDVNPISNLRKELLNAKSKENSVGRISVNNTVLEQFKKIYDAADIIYDKRFDKDDSSDSNSENKTRNVDHELDRFNYKYGNDLPLRERALMSLWDYAENELSGSKYELEGVLAVYSCVARGNICLRLSNIYFDNYNLIESDKWGNRANEILWQGKNIINNHKNRTIPNGLNCSQNDILILDWLVSFNLAKYYRDYASRNRRSDYLSAVRLLDEIKYDIENRIDCFEDKESEQARQCGMLYAETIRNDITISKRRSIKGGERKAFYFARVLFDDCGITDEALVNDLDIELNDISDYFDKKDRKETNTENDHFVDTVDDGYINKDIINLINGYSRKRMLLLALLILARCLRSMHEYEMYKKAIETAGIANRISQDMDMTQNVNIDALIIISNCLRKYCIYANNNDDMSDDNMLQIVLKNEGNQKIKLKNLFIELKVFADSRHLLSKTELIKWYCMLFEDRKRYQLGYLSSIVTWESFPDEEYIIDLLNKPSKNALLEFYRSKMLLDTSCYSEAEKVFTDLINSNKEYYSVTYYIRTGSIGLKIRYLLANTYMAQGKYYQAKCILEEINNSLNAVKRLTEKEKEENQYEDVYTDLRVLIDLAYCNIKRGDYTAAFNLYDNYYEISKKIIKSHIIDDSFLNKLPKYKRIAGINNLITCCLLNNNESKRKYGRDLLDEIDELDNYNYSLRVSDFFYNPETNLLRGLREVLNKNYKGAHEFFSRSCQKEIYYKPQYFSNEINETNLGALYNNVEYISAYLINSLNLYESPKYKEESEAEIKSFIEGLPNNRMLSLKAAIALANWLLKCNEEEDTDRLFRYFSYIKIYEERGAGTFNKLDKKNNGKYRLYRSVERGKILAHLLALYKPINNLKEMCTFSLRDYESISRRNPVHYTTIKALKGIIGEGNESFFRLSNCGNANDVYEGHIFFECLKNAVLKVSEDLPYSSKYIDQDDPADMESIVLETGSDVYIASFSQNRDSFPMWTIYSQEETGCNIEFGDGFFDIFGDVSEYDDLALLNDYLPSYYMDQDYPLYTIQYIKNEGKELRNVTKSTNQIQMDTVNELLLQIDKKWHELYSLLQGFNSVFQSESDSQTCLDAYTGGMDTVLSVAADLVNEVRFLFKNSDFSYESEARIVYTETNATPKTDYQREIPVTYVNMNRNIGEINVTLGSKLSYSDVDKIETWLMRTGHVNKVEVTETNRLKNSRKHKSN